MAAIKIIVVSRLPVMVLFMYLCVLEAKTTDNKTNINNSAEVKPPKKISDTGALMFADELKQTLEKYLFGICPQSYKMPLASKGKNITTLTCDLDEEQQDLAGKLATLALRAHTASRSDCTRFGVALANTLGELARTAASRQTISSAAANEANKKQRKLSKSQKLKIQAKQKTALAVKKKAAAVAAAAAAKMTS